MQNKKILFTGYYGFKNLGDDMFGLVSVWGAEKYWRNSNIALLSGEGAVSKKVNIRYVLSSKQHFKGQLLLGYFLETLKTKYIILSGGSILHSKPPRLSPRRFAYQLAKLKLIKMGAIGVSLGPFKSNEDYKYIESVLQSFKFLALRDKASYDIAFKMNLPYNPVLAADLAFILPSIKNVSLRNDISRENKVIGISLCHYERYQGKDINNEKRREDAIYTVLYELQKDMDIKFRFFVINGNNRSGDLELTQSMIKRLSLESKQYELIPYSTQTLDIFNLIDSCDVMYSTRLHGAIFAAAANVPSLLVEYHQKCTDYLDDIGVNQEWRIGDMQIAPNEIIIKIKKLLESKQNNFYPNRKKMLELSQKNFTDRMIMKEMI